MSRKVLLVLVALSFVACASQSNMSKAPEQKKTSTQDWVWRSQEFDLAARIDKSFAYYGDSTRQRGNNNSHYYVWANDESGEIILLTDWNSTSWSIPEDEDGLVQSDSEFLLEHKDNEYAIWKGMGRRWRRFLDKIGVQVPKCVISLDKAYINPENRSEAVWVTYVKPWDCDYSNFKTIIQDRDSAINFKL